jgi:hypothetical protein
MVGVFTSITCCVRSACVGIKITLDTMEIELALEKFVVFVQLDTTAA